MRDLHYKPEVYTECKDKYVFPQSEVKDQTTLGLSHLELSKLFLFAKRQNNERQCVRDLVINVLKIYLNNDGKPK